MNDTAREEMFGEWSESLVPEAVWSFHWESGLWPLWDEVLESLELFPSVAAHEDAVARLEKAVADGEVQVELVGHAHGFWVTVSKEQYDAITRRYMDLQMQRRDREENT